MGDHKNILLVGDWTLEERWITGKQSIATSSRTGGAHRFILNDDKQEIISASGAGRVASSLLRNQCVNLYGLGRWEDGGEDIIRSFYTNYGPERKKRNEFRVGWQPIDYTKAHTDQEYPGKVVELCNLSSAPTNAGTDRVIRIYEKVADTLKLLERIDFVLKKDKHESQEEQADAKKARINAQLDAFFAMEGLKDKEFGAIIIKDLSHGAIDKFLIQHLAEKFPISSKVPWYISSKEWKPEWFESLNNVKIGLLMIPQTAANQALFDKDFGIDCWMTPNGYVSKEALDFVQDPHRWLNYKDPLQAAAGNVNRVPGVGDQGKVEYLKNCEIQRVIILPEKNRVIATDSSESVVSSLVLQIDAKDKFSDIDLPMASMFFPEIIQGILWGNSEEWVAILQFAMDRTSKWREAQYDFLKYNVERQGVPGINTICNSKLEVKESKEWKAPSHKSALDNWVDSLNPGKLGIRKGVNPYNPGSGRERNVISKFELWRAKTTLDDYISIADSKKRKLRSLVQSLRREEGTRLKRAEVCFIKAAPGSGKSHLVNCLAKALKVELLSFNLSQYQSKSQLIDCFDDISTFQAANRDKPILVFFDEINTRLEGDYAYSTFLAPLEDGYYMRGNRKFRLEPCIWIFVGTDFQTGNKDKASDFRSRFTMPIINLFSTEEELLERNKVLIGLKEKHLELTRRGTVQGDLDLREKQKTDLQTSIKQEEGAIAKLWTRKSLEQGSISLEKVYYCVQFVCIVFKSVRTISSGAFEIFAMIRPEASVRDIRKLIESVKHIPNEVFSASILIKHIRDQKDSEAMRNLFAPTELEKIEKYEENTINEMEKDPVILFEKPVERKQ